MTEPFWYNFAGVGSHVPRSRRELSFEDYDTRGYSHAPNRAMVQELDRPDPVPQSVIEQFAYNYARSPEMNPDRARVEAGEREERARIAERDPRNQGRLAAFARSAGTTALDSLAAPVTLPARALERLGYPNEAAHLSAEESVAEAESFARDESLDDSRARGRITRDANPRSARAGEVAGEALAAFATAGAERAAPYVAERNLASYRPQGMSDAAARARASRLQRGGLRVKTGSPIRSDSPATEKAVRDTLGFEPTPESIERLAGIKPELGKMKPTDQPKDLDIELFATREGGFGFETRIGGKTGTTTLTEIRRDGDELVAVHEYVNARPKGEGISTDLLRNQVQEYDRLGVSRIELTAAAEGRNQWPYLGFELKDPGDFYNSVLRGSEGSGGFAAYLKSKGVPLSEVKGVTNINELATWSSGAASGREYLTSPYAPTWIDMKADLNGPGGDLLRRKLGLQPRRRTP